MLFQYVVFNPKFQTIQDVLSDFRWISYGLVRIVAVTEFEWVAVFCNGVEIQADKQDEANSIYA